MLLFSVLRLDKLKKGDSETSELMCFDIDGLTAINF